jgi:dTDP-4-dehydrorhamnose reductase/dTDP-4-dehydrorhamnose 3,5-epimerase
MSDTVTLYNKELQIQKTSIPGLLLVDLPVHGDNRGWFKENWQREKMTRLGLPDFGPVQNNISFNAQRGVTRGIHAEPWDKYVSVAAGRIFGAWVDLREGESFGQVYTTEIDPTKAIFVPRGVGNAFQALEPDTAYTYLVNDHWSVGAQSLYTFLNLADETAAIMWPIPLADAELSDKDKAHPRLKDVRPMSPRKILITGSKGQLGTALHGLFPTAEYTDHETFDITNPAAYESRHWKEYDTIINAAAYTVVDNAETTEGRRSAWNINVMALTHLAKVATDNNITLVHISSDYVFDGTLHPHTEDESFSPLSAYGQTKAAADAIVATIPRHYIVRTSWVVGNGKNFVNTMQELCKRGVKPSVVNDQFGRLTFTGDLARGIHFLLEQKSPYGTYNLSNEGDVVSWAQVAQAVYAASGGKAEDVAEVTTADYYAGKEHVAPRPTYSDLDLHKLAAAGFVPRDWQQALYEYIKQESE